jgi:hypothetical protein
MVDCGGTAEMILGWMAIGWESGTGEQFKSGKSKREVREDLATHQMIDHGISDLLISHVKQPHESGSHRS